MKSYPKGQPANVGKPIKEPPAIKNRFMQQLHQEHEMRQEAVIAAGKAAAGGYENIRATMGAGNLPPINKNGKSSVKATVIPKKIAGYR